MNKQSASNIEKFNWWIRTNKITATLIAIGTIVIALSTFTDAARNLLDLVVQEKRPEINGVWTAEITYDWARATYTETFIFGGDGDELSGVVSFLKIGRPIAEGNVSDDEIRFTTETTEVSGSWDNPSKLIHHYSGELSDDEIIFTLQTEGGVLPLTPVHFRAYRVPETTP